MSKILAGVVPSDILAALLLAAIGSCVFFLLRPREEDAPEEFWLAPFVKNHSEAGKPETNPHTKSDEPKSGGAVENPGERRHGLFGI